MLAAGLLLGLIGVQAEQARQQESTVAVIRELGGRVAYDYSAKLAQGTPTSGVADSVMRGMRTFLGDDFFDTVIEVDLFRTQISDDFLIQLQALNDLEVLHLGSNAITNAGLVHIGSLDRLRILTLQVTHVTDAGLRELEKLEKLEYLILPSHPDQFSRAGLDRLAGALPNCKIVR